MEYCIDMKMNQCEKITIKINGKIIAQLKTATTCKVNDGKEKIKTD